jgi:hypothetical protein
MHSWRTKTWRATVLTAFLAVVVSSSMVKGENTGSEEDTSWSPNSSLRLQFFGDSLPQGTSNDKMFSASSAAIAQTNRWLREINMRGSETASFSGGPGETVVLRLQDLRMGANSVLTLDGAADTTYLIKIRHGLSLSGNAQVVLTGGLTWDDVTFKLRGTGEDVQLNGSSSLEGIVMARKRAVRLRNQATIYGNALGWVNLSDSAQIINPPVVSP